MNAIVGFTQLVLSTSLTAEQRDYIDTIETSSNALLNIINDILDFSNMEANKLEVEYVSFSLGEILKKLSILFKAKIAEKGLTLRIINKGTSRRIIGDPIRLEQVLINLIGNAVKFTQTGTITININPIDQLEEKISLQFSIEDTGIGICEETIPSLFDSFSQADGSTTRKFGGTGLGLAICQRIINIMDGKIWLESQPNKGTVVNFILTFNFDFNQEINEPNILSTSIAIANKTKILLVEDNLINQKLVKLILTKKGFLVYVADNGIEAIEMIESNDFDVVFMDIQMPEMSGNETTRLIRKNPKYADLPIIAMTAHAMANDKEKSLAVGMNDYITKPIDTKQLFNTLNKWIK